MATNRARTIGAVLLATGLAGPAAATPPLLEGSQLYMHACAACHGVTADGRGPVAEVLSPPPRDLRTLAHRYGDPLPTDRIAQFIDGRELVKAHGPREMPVWGEELRERGKGPDPEAAVRRKIDAIVAYLVTLQTK